MPDQLVLEPCIAQLGDRVDGFLLAISPASEILFANDSWCTRLRSRPDEVHGRALLDVVTQSTRARARRSIDDVFAGRPLGPLQLHVHGPDDQIIAVDGHLTRMQLDQGAIALAFLDERPLSIEVQPFSVPVDREVTLTERQLAVLQLFASGHTTKQVASVLGIAVKTVHNHLTTIYRVLDAQSLVQATMIAAKLGLVELAAPVSTGPVVILP